MEVCDACIAQAMTFQMYASKDEEAKIKDEVKRLSLLSNPVLILLTGDAPGFEARKHAAAHKTVQS